MQSKRILKDKVMQITLNKQPTAVQQAQSKPLATTVLLTTYLLM